jgi:hypothetical protein
MRAFMKSRERFVFQLCQAEIADAIRAADPAEMPEEQEIESALAQLCEWGNLQSQPDISDVRIVEDFYKPRHVYQMTGEGEAVERACAQLISTSTYAELQSSGLTEIREAMQELQQLSVMSQPDSGKIRRKLRTLHALFDDLSITAQAFIEKLEQRAKLQPAEVRQLIEFSQRLSGELESEADQIGAIVRELDAAGVVDSPYWERCRSWFISQPARPSNSDALRERTRAAIPLLLRGFAADNDRKLHRIDRASDFRVLAGWFAKAESDAEAHVLWRSAFGLCSARHLSINEATLDDRETQHVPPNTSWLDAPPLRIPDNSHERRGSLRIGGLSRIIDRSSEKEKLAAAAHEESQRLLETQRRFGSGNRVRLSELEHLESDELDLFLDLLGEASSKAFAAETLEILSGDGRLRVRLEPVNDGRTATILTSDGMLSGPDHWILIEPVSFNEAKEAAR